MPRDLSTVLGLDGSRDPDGRLSASQIAEEMARDVRGEDDMSYFIGEEHLVCLSGRNWAGLRELAERMFGLMVASGESQGVVFRGHNSHKDSAALAHLLSHMSSSSSSSPSSSHRPVTPLAEKIDALEVLTSAFGSCYSEEGSTGGPRAFSSYLELVYDIGGRLTRLLGAQYLTFNLDRSVLTSRKRPGQKAFQVLYDLVGGATAAEEKELALLGSTSDYEMLGSGRRTDKILEASSERAVAVENLNKIRRAFSVLGFKQRHTAAVMRILSALLLLGNVAFRDSSESDGFVSSAADTSGNATPISVANRDVLESAAGLLEVDADDVEHCLVHGLQWSRSEMVETLLDAEGAQEQRDTLISGVYAVLFAFIVETANHELMRGMGENKERDQNIVVLSLFSVPTSPFSTPKQPLSRSRTLQRQNTTLHNRTFPLDTFEDFLVNVENDIVHFLVAERTVASSEASFMNSKGRLDFFFGSGFPEKAGGSPSGLFGLLDGFTRRVLAQGASRRVLGEVRDEWVRAAKEEFRGSEYVSNTGEKRGGGAARSTTLGGRKGLLEEPIQQERSKNTLLERQKSLLEEQNGAGTAQDPFDSFDTALERSKSKSALTSSFSPGRISFGLYHTLGEALYDTQSVIPGQMDLFDANFVSLFNTSSDSFTNKLLSGPGLGAELHPLDDSVLVSAQISSLPLRGPVEERGSFKGKEGDIREEQQPFGDTFRITPRSTQVYRVLRLLCGLSLAKKVLFSVTSLRGSLSGIERHVEVRFLTPQVEMYGLGEMVSLENIKGSSFALEMGVGEVYGGRESGGGEEQEKEEEAEARRLLVGHLGLKEGREFAFGEKENQKRVFLTLKAVLALERNKGRRITMNNTDTRGQGHLSAPLDNPFSGEDMDFTREGKKSLKDARTISEEHIQLLGEEQDGYGEVALVASHNAGPEHYEMGYLDAQERGMSRQSFNPWGKTTPNATHLDTKENTLLEGKTPLDENGQIIGKSLREAPISRARRSWTFLVWILTGCIPTWCLKRVGKMKRPDVRMAWREKVALCLLIGFLCGVVVFYIVVFGKLLCPNMDKAWSVKELGYHTGENDLYVAVRGVVYDISAFSKIQHSDISSEPVESDTMSELGGLDMTDYFPIPLTAACPTLVNDTTVALQYANFTAVDQGAVHTSGPLQSFSSSALYNVNWYFETFIPAMKRFKKGPLVFSKGKVSSMANDESRTVVFIDRKVYDVTDYVYTIDLEDNLDAYTFLNSSVMAVFSEHSGGDATKAMNELKESGTIDSDTLAANLECIETLFYIGEYDFRKDAACQVQPDLLLAFSIIIVATIGVKFLASLQLGSRKMPEMRDKFVLLQVTCYTEGEESLKKTIDSLATSEYDDKRKLLLIICDGMIVGSGNEQATPRIVLGILGGDATENDESSSSSPPLMFKSIAEGAQQLNYGKVWSGLYDVEGHVVPYLVVAKVGRPAEKSRPGNRGKRDSQILAMRFLNRVHFDAPMYPLELEMAHQIRNVIGVDPALYEFLLVVDADTQVEKEAVNRLVAHMADDAKIVGLCGETLLENEKNTWWTMIQVYEYFISHHMAKAFESLFGSVTCLPGCFTMYRLRSADKGKPLLISSSIIEEYSDNTLDTLHKKNLLALGEDRFLTTLILKHFPEYKTKFTPDAQAKTVAPDEWKVLVSQRRRWINSTVHNLAELVFLDNMCGVCCFGMRFIVLLDLVSTLILPATFVYLVYLIVSAATGKTAIPVISLAMLGAVYGLQAVVFLLKRQWQYIGWLVIYLLAYPVYSFVLPLYSFWRFDDFSWGNTRVVVGEGKSKKVLSTEEEEFDERVIPMRRFAEYGEILEMYDRERDRGTLYTTERGPLYQEKERDTLYSVPLNEYPLGAPQRHSNLYSSPNHNSLGQPYHITGVDPPEWQRPLSQLRNSVTLNATPQPRQSYAFSSLPLAAPPMIPNPTSFIGHYPFPSMPDLSRIPPTANPNPNPTDEELVHVMKAFLATQDLMKVTKRSTRQYLASVYPSADLERRKASINSNIDLILAGKV